jgi:hypothetical protein
MQEDFAGLSTISGRNKSLTLSPPSLTEMSEQLAECFEVDLISTLSKVFNPFVRRRAIQYENYHRQDWAGGSVLIY